MPEEKYSHKVVKKIRFRIPDIPGALGTLALKLGTEGATLGDITKIHLTSNYIVRDITAFFDNEAHFNKAITAVKKLKGYKILSIQDEVLNLHKGGKIEIKPRVKVETLNDLRMIYTPGVARVCNYIVAHPDAAKKYTCIGNMVCIATNGSAVLGLGNIGVLAAMPVMEGKSIILNKMANVSCMPLLINSDDADTIVNTLSSVAETFGAIMIEDIKAPLCFEVEEKLQKKVKIPVFHDDQHGTATVILAALLRALKIARKRKENVKIVINGAGAAGIAATKLLLGYGFKHITLCDRAGAIYKGRLGGMNEYKEEAAKVTNKNLEKGSLKDVIKGKDVFIGLSSAGLVTKDMVKTMNKPPIVFALANPIPEIWPKNAQEAGAVVALDGRTINNALVFPGLIRGALNANACIITQDMKFSAAEMIASLAGKNDIVPNFMHPDVHEKVARAVVAAADKTKR
ncbi:MAG: NAD-dependent malic enzyme [Candidatus Omnitrophica bacterium]|nr:NAD-dependent malic enzyme [Candidatus Omnitrophota bacterium]